MASRPSGLATKINDQADNIAKLKRSLAESQHQCSSLQELLRQAEDRLNQHIEQARQELAEAKKVEEDLTSDNGRLFERNTELELERDRLDKRCQELDDLWRQRIDAAIKEESNRNATLEEEVESQRQRVTELSSLVDQMARDNAEAVRRLEEIRMERDELRRSTALLETKVHTVGSISRMNGTPLRF
ncbi:hypothetical protein AAVH_24639 [Aphelenchoides avenae]|nr:hypothetical protein AAVH_24639 [Aphelenchus avenae]